MSGLRSPSAPAAQAAAQLDIAGIVELALVIADQRFQVPGLELAERPPIPIELRIGVAVGAGKMRHAAACQHHGLQAERGHGARDGLPKGVAALHRRLGRQIGIHIDRQHRIGVAEVRQWNADRIIDLGRAGEGGIEVLPIELTHDLETDLARNLPVEFAAGEVAACLPADMDSERRRGGVEELLGMIIREDDPEVGPQCAQLPADVGPDLPHVLDHVFVFGLGHGEELRRMGQHGAADHARHHDFSPRASDAGEHQVVSQPRKYRADQGTTRRRFTAKREASTLCPTPPFAPIPPPSRSGGPKWSRCR